MSTTKNAYQPVPMAAMDVKEAPVNQEAQESACGTRCQCQHRHKTCHRRRTRRAAHYAIASMLMLAIMAFVSLNDWESCLFGFGSNDIGSGSLERRQNSTGTNNNGTQSSFVRNKLYLIVVIVGLFVCLILAVMLAAWCCRGAFENPLCCPCYLCACCGGLACLECISCGLCAEGVDQLNF